MFFRRDALHVAKGAQHGFVGTQLLIGLAAERLAHAAGQNAVHVGNRRDDPGNQIVLQLEDRLGTEGAFEAFGPEMSAAQRIDELNGEPQPGPGLTQAAFHHVARAQFLPDRPHVDGCIGVPRRGAARDDPKVREARQARDDLFGHRLGQGREVGVGAAVLERQHRDPEAFLGASRARIGRRLRNGRGGAGLVRTAQRPQLGEDLVRGLDAVAGPLLEAPCNEAR